MPNGSALWERAVVCRPTHPQTAHFQLSRRYGLLLFFFYEGLRGSALTPCRAKAKEAGRHQGQGPQRKGPKEARETRQGAGRVRRAGPGPARVRTRIQKLHQKHFLGQQSSPWSPQPSGRGPRCLQGPSQGASNAGG